MFASQTNPLILNPVNTQTPPQTTLKKGNTCLPIVTVVALLALSAVAVGVLAIIASIPGGPAGLGVMHQIGWQAGLMITSVGVLTLITMIVVAVLRYRQAKKQEKGKANSEETSPTKEGQIEITPKVKELEALKTEEILNLKLSSIIGFSDTERSEIFKRLVHLNQEQEIITTPPRDLATIPQDALTLADLRSIDISKIPNGLILDECWGMLTAEQATALLQSEKNITADFLNLLLPTKTGGQYTYARLKTIPIDTLTPHLANLTCDHLELFSKDQLKHQAFPWAAFFAKKEIGWFIHCSKVLTPEILSSQSIPWKDLPKHELDLLLSSKHDTIRTKEVLNAIHIDSLNTLFTEGKLGGELLQLLDLDKRKILNINT